MDKLLVDSGYRWDAILQEACEAAGAPGASLAVLHRGRVTTAVAGVRTLGDGALVTVDTVFQIGSITKVLTASLLMRLADKRKISLDQPVITYLPSLRLGNAEAARAVTLRHLLAHISGLDGDFFPAMDGGTDLYARYMNALESVPQLHSVGTRFSYCNAGYVLAGHLVEAVSGLTWEEAMHAWLFAPLGMASAATGLENADTRLSACGHISADGGQGELQPQPNVFALPISAAPAGTTTTMTAVDLLRFVHLHLRGRYALDGELVLSAQATEAMQMPQVALPAYAAAGTTAWGLGWAIYDWGGHRLFGHDGDTIGQRSFLRVEPETGTAVALLINGGRANIVADQVFSAVFGNLAGICPPSVVKSSNAVSFDPDTYVGTYGRLGRRLNITTGEGGLVLMFHDDFDDGMQDPAPVKLHPVDVHVFQGYMPALGVPVCFQFGDFDNTNCAGSVFSGYRLAVRLP